MLVRLHLSADKIDSCLPSLSLYFNIYFASTDATMFQNIQQSHSGGSNTNSFRLLATLFKTKKGIDTRILCSELSQLKRIAIINPPSNCVCKFCPYRCYILKFNTLANRFECAKLIKKGYPFPSCRYNNQLIKKGTLFHLLQTNLIAHYHSLQRNFHLRRSFHNF